MKKLTLSHEARARIARQIAETTGVLVNCNGAVGVLASTDRDHFKVGAGD